MNDSDQSDATVALAASQATEPRRAPGRERCPTCNAPRHGKTICHRCRSDLTALVDLERRVDRLAARARRCYAQGWYRLAAALAGRIAALERTSEHVAMLACARLMAGDFPAAADAYHARRSEAS